MLKHLFRPRPQTLQAEALYARVVDQARQPAFYTTMATPDRIDARFELYTLHILLLLMRLRAEGERGADIGQRLFNVYVSALDDSLRELGVGDLSVAKKMRKLGEALYGRMKAYETPLEAGDADTLALALARNVHEVEDAARGAPLAAYALAARDSLSGQGLDDLLTAPAWPEITT